MSQVFLLVILSALFATSVLALPSGLGGTAQLRSDYLTVLNRACPAAGIDATRVKSEVNAFFKCMSESTTNYREAPLVIPTTVEQIKRIDRKYLQDQCPTYQEKSLCGARFYGFFKSCNVDETALGKTSKVPIANTFNLFYVAFGDKVCHDNGNNFAAFLEETQKSCTLVNLAGLIVNWLECTKQKLGSAEAVVQCVEKKYQTICTGFRAVTLFRQFWHGESSQQGQERDGVGARDHQYEENHDENY